MLDNYSNFLILGPGRTGSLTIARSLYSLYHYDDKKYNYISPDVAPRPLEKNDIVHTHTIGWLNFVTEKTKVILSVRDPVESALSWCIQPYLKRYHFYGFKQNDIEHLRNFKITKFFLDPNIFLTHYQNAINFYISIEIKSHYQVVDYRDWSEHPINIFNILELNSKPNLKFLTLKNPGSHKDFIENYEEISKIMGNLNRKVIFKSQRQPHVVR